MKSRVQLMSKLDSVSSGEYLRHGTGGEHTFLYAEEELERSSRLVAGRKGYVL
jgi:hypothetical protein